MAFAGTKNAIWASVGNELKANSTIAEWKTQAGMDWEAQETLVRYSVPIDGKATPKVYPAKKILFRSDTKDPLSIVGDKFRVVQPGEILEFFADLTKSHGMTLATAGCLFGGRRFWALADMDKEVEIVKGDGVKGQLLLTTALDGTLATTAKFVSVRSANQGVMTISTGKTKNMMKRTHRGHFDPKEVKIQMGLIDNAWNVFVANLKKMAVTKVPQDQARKFFQDKFFDPKQAADEQSWGAVRKVNNLMDLFNNGQGAEFSAGTQWGLLNAVTEEFTHGNGKRDKSHQFWDSFHGSRESIKTDVYQSLIV
jgi:phage/plasmid-like protein (TIGR03299 family)